MTNRRGFIKSGALAVFGMGLNTLPAYVLKAANAFTQNIGNKRKILIVIFQRGAMDGLMAVSPFNDPFLKKARPTLMMSPSKNGDNGLFDLDGRFGLHTGFSSLYPLFQKNELAIIHGVGSPNKTRSHFDAQDYMESGTPFSKSTDSGWLNRTSGLMEKANSPFRAVSITRSMPRSYYGDNPTLTISNLDDLRLKNRNPSSNAMLTAKSFEDLYDQTANALMSETGKETFEAMDMVSKIQSGAYKPHNDAVYPKSELGKSLMQLAQLIRSDVGLQIGFAESTGWDTHFNQGTSNGIFARNASDLGNSVSAFWQDLGADWQEHVVVMTMTEFGRTVKQNGTGGTDHGRASCYFLLGKNVNGGKVHGNVTDLDPANLDEGRDLMVTTDFRSVFEEVAKKQLNISNNGIIFPDWKSKGIGLMKG
ncbi:MAG: hypothetical protein RIR96_447 [Bacteroidota bacterium]